MKIHTLLTEEMIILKLLSQDRDGVLSEMVKFLKEKNKIRKDKELYEKLIQREKLGSTAIGEGMAIPHCKLKEVEAPLVALAISRQGVEFGAPDRRPTQVFFLVISSPENPGVSLQILAAIAHLIRKSGSLLKKLMGAKNTRRALEIIRNEEEKIGE
ncbi:MAG: PTS sugar transporter subunit IIA [Acidobacteriota bacterium]